MNDSATVLLTVLMGVLSSVRSDAAGEEESHNVSVAVTARDEDGEVVTVPTSYREAMQSKHADKWKNAIQEHLDGLAKLKTFAVKQVHERARTIPTKWVFDVKVDDQGIVTRWKARLVAQGFRQREHIDFKETFAPAIRSEQIRLMLAVAAKHFGTSKQARDILNSGTATAEHYSDAFSSVATTGDVKDAYLTSAMPEDEQLYCTIPPGWDQSIGPAPPGYKNVLLTLTALPGLKQSGRVYYLSQRDALILLGFVPSEIAQCIYVKVTESGVLVIGHFVDDLITLNLSSDPHAFDDVRAALNEHYTVHYASRLNKFVGAQFHTTEDGVYMHLTQYTEDLIAKYGQAAGTKKATTPEGNDDMAQDERLLQRADVQHYQSLTGALMFATTICRPDLAHAVNMLARRMASPRVCDLSAAYRVIRYLRHRTNYGLLFRFDQDERYPGFVAYADSDWAQDPERRLSTTGYIILFNGVPVSWHTGLQSVIALSTCEAEYIALSECCRELVYLRELAKFLRDPSVDAPTVIHEDNQGTIDLVNNPVHHKRSKHIEVKWHYIRMQQREGRVEIKKIHTNDNLADMFTKATSPQTFTRHFNAIMREIPGNDVEGGC